MKKLYFQQGQFIIELLITIGLTSIMLPALLTGFFSVRSSTLSQDQKLQAVSYLKEAVEAVRIVRNNSWSQVATNGTFHPIISGSSWILVSGTEVISPYNFSRQIVIDNVYRDLNGTIVTTGGTLDSSTKKVTVTVSWNAPVFSNVNSVIYITRYLDNNSLIQTSETDFNAGSITNTVITNINGGEVTLGAGGGGSWCDPNLSITALDLPKNGVANAVSAIEGGAFAGTGDNASGVSFANITIANTKPPIASIVGTFDGFKTNGVFGETNYAYLATDTVSKEIEIIDLTHLTDGKYPEAGYFNAPGNDKGNSVFVLGNIGYMISGNHLYTFDLSSKSGSRPQLGTVSLAGTGNKIYVIGSYAYIAVDSDTTQLQIIQVSPDGRTLTVVGWAQVNGREGKGIYVNNSATRAYLATEASLTQRELFILDISTKTGNRTILGSYDSNGMNPKGITVVPGNKAILVGSGAEEYQVIDITNETNPIRCGGLQIDTGVNGVSGIIEQDGDAYSYIITGDTSTEFKIIEGGPGGQYASSGTFTSGVFDAGSTVTFNRFIPTFTQPNQASIQFQIAVADAVSDSCTNANYYFIGPDGTSGTYFTSAGPIPLADNGQGYVNPGRCIKYKAYLSTSDLSQAPVLYDVSFNYSP